MSKKTDLKDISVRKLLQIVPFDLTSLIYPPLKLPGPGLNISTHPRLTVLENDPKLYQQVFENSPNSILITSNKVKIIYVNPAWEELTGYKFEEVVGKNPRIVSSGQTPRAVYLKMWRKLKKGEGFTNDEMINKRKDGSLYQSRSSVFPIKKNNGDIFYVQIQHDITKAKQQEEAMVKYSFLVESSQDAIIGINTEGIIDSWNPTAEKLYGYKKEEAIGMAATRLIPAEEKFHLKSIFNRLKKGSNLKSFETVCLRKDQQEVYVCLTVSPIINSKKKLVGYSASSHDISEKKELENARAELFSIMAHELKTPLTTLKLLSQTNLIRYKKHGIDKINVEELQLLDRELDRLTRIVNEILDDQRLEIGKFKLQMDSVDIIQLIQEVVIQTKTLTKSHRFIYPTTDFSPTVVVDRDRLKQVFTNLISNAIKYSSAGSTIEIDLKKVQQFLQISVKDQGIGIPKEKLAHIFDRFYQIHEHSPTGFGLGLYIAKQIIKRHKGKIWAKSTPGKGSTFFFTLPLLMAK